MAFADSVFASKAGKLDPPVEITERFNMVDTYLNETLVSSPNPVDYTKLGDPFKIKNFQFIKKVIQFKISFSSETCRYWIIRSILE